MTVQQAVEKYKLDRRHKWFSFGGYVVYDYKYTHACSGCSCDCSDVYGCSHGNSGCSECGYTGKRRGSVPCVGLDDKEEPIETTDKDFVYYKKP